MNVRKFDEDYDYCFAVVEDLPYETLKELLGERVVFPDCSIGWAVQTLNGVVTITPLYNQGYRDDRDFGPVITWTFNSDATGSSDDPGAAVTEVLNQIKEKLG